jgi:hypothetical protein
VIPIKIGKGQIAGVMHVDRRRAFRKAAVTITQKDSIGHSTIENVNVEMAVAVQIADRNIVSAFYIERWLRTNQSYVEGFGDKGSLALPPARRFAILACMDARLDPAKFAGLAEGDAHVIRNAGGRASDDAIRSLIISHKLLGTNEWLERGPSSARPAGMHFLLQRGTDSSRPAERCPTSPTY